MRPQNFKLYGRVIIKATLKAETGIRIGRGKESISIGGLDNSVIRDPVSNVPFLPGSSLKGKLRSLAERHANVDFDYKLKVHFCRDENSYMQCPICRLYGVPAQVVKNFPTRLVVRDVNMHQDSVKFLDSLDMDQPYTEIKWEAVIDRVSSVATPRPMERVPAGTKFGPLEMVVTLYYPSDTGLINDLITAMSLLEDDYLGGSGSRGSGKVSFEDLEFMFKPGEKYQHPISNFVTVKAKNLDEARQKKDEIVKNAKALVGKAGGG